MDSRTTALEFEELTELEKQTMWQVIAQHGPSLMVLCRRAAGNESDAEALFSDEVLRMMPGRIRNWDGKRPFLHYIRNYFALHLRKIVARRRKKQPSSVDDHEAKMLSIVDTRINRNGTYTIDPAIEEAVHIIMESLPSTIEKIIVWQSWAEGRTIREVADIVSWSPTSVQVKLTKLRPVLLQLLQKAGYDYFE